MRRTPLLAFAVLLVAAACAKSQTSTAPSPTHEAMKSEGTMKSGEGMMMKMPAYADAFHASFTTPDDGVRVTDNSLNVSVKTTGFTPRCDLAGKFDQAGVGHYHLLLDKVLVNMFCTSQASVSMQNVRPGMHTLEVVPALNEHDEVMKNGQTIKFDYEPTSPLPVITGETRSGSPSIQILSPRSGDTVTGTFDIKVKITGFENSCNLFGKPDVAGYGHWHANLDTTTGAMMGMGAGKNGKGGMLGMSCTDTFRASTAGLGSGETHTLFALLVGNSHAPLNPAVMDKVDVKIG